jgi:heme exporter protein C
MWQWFVKWFHKWSSPKWFYELSKPWSFGLAVVAVLLISVSLIWGLGFAPVERLQGNSYRIIFLHVPAAFMSEAIYMAIAVAGAVGLIWRIKLAFYVAKQYIPIGASMAILALATGAIWGKPTWGAWWVWDARVTSMLILFFLYVGVIALFEAYDNKTIAARACAILSLVGTVNIPIIYKSVDWWYSLHQPASIKFTGSSAIDASMLYPLLGMIVAFYALFALLMMLNLKQSLTSEYAQSNWLIKRITT